MAAYLEIAAHPAYEMFTYYEYIIVNLVCSHLGFWIGNFFLIALFLLFAFFNLFVFICIFMHLSYIYGSLYILVKHFIYLIKYTLYWFKDL